MSRPKDTVILRFANIAVFLFAFAVNLLDQIAPLNGKTTGEISDLYPTLFTPAGYVFLIWFVIYVLLLIFVIFQALPNQAGKAFIDRIDYLFVLSNIANVSWLFLWHYEQIVLSTLPMLALLGTLIAIYLRLQIGISKVSLGEKLAVHVPFSVYLGWITVATIGNIAAALTAVKWDGWGVNEVAWTVLMIIVATIVTLTVIATRRDAAYSLVVVWAFLGIIVKEIADQSIVITASVGVAAIAVFLIVAMAKAGGLRKRDL